jgi:hypothetical protein
MQVCESGLPAAERRACGRPALRSMFTGRRAGGRTVRRDTLLDLLHGLQRRRAKKCQLACRNKREEAKCWGVIMLPGPPGLPRPGPPTLRPRSPQGHVFKKAAGRRGSARNRRPRGPRLPEGALGEGRGREEVVSKQLQNMLAGLADRV